MEVSRLLLLQSEEPGFLDRIVTRDEEQILHDNQMCPMECPEGTNTALGKATPHKQGDGHCWMVQHGYLTIQLVKSWPKCKCRVLLYSDRQLMAEYAFKNTPRNSKSSRRRCATPRCKDDAPEVELMEIRDSPSSGVLARHVLNRLLPFQESNGFHPW
uniref:Pre-SET domain-containing protein n=1 Tax=Bursaphelenchus xylophilus TaxID=6326 RepID=A0A1I7S1D3_BURXY